MIVRLTTHPGDPSACERAKAGIARLIEARLFARSEVGRRFEPCVYIESSGRIGVEPALATTWCRLGGISLDPAMIESCPRAIEIHPGASLLLNS